MSAELWEIALTAGLAVFLGLVAYAMRRGWIDEDLRLALVGVFTSATDEVKAEIHAAKRPESEGGSEITKGERKRILDIAQRAALSDLPPHLVKYAKRKGPEWIRGWLSHWFDKEAADAPAPASAAEGA